MGMIKNLIHEFKEFAIKGNAIDLAVGVVIGAAFSGVVQSLVKDVIMPPLGLLTGGIDFSDKKIVLKPIHIPLPGETATPADLKEVNLSYGNFINQIVNFIIVAAAIFAVVKVMNMMHRKHEEQASPPVPEMTPEEKVLTEIRDILKAKETK